MILTGSEDLRVCRTIDSIKSVFEQMICEMDYDKIRVTELCSRAMINKKTFYVYYPTLDDLLAELQSEYAAEYIERIKNFRLPDELDKVNREYTVFKILCAVDYPQIFPASAFHRRLEQFKEIRCFARISAKYAAELCQQLGSRYLQAVGRRRQTAVGRGDHRTDEQARAWRRKGIFQMRRAYEDKNTA